MGRSAKLEYLDLGPSHYTQTEYHNCLRLLGRIGRKLGGDRLTFEAIQGFAHRPSSFLDVGCGGGDFTRRLGEAYPNARVTGIDLNGEAIDYASAFDAPNCRFEHRTSKELDDPDNSYDVVTSTLTCHHMEDGEIVRFLQQTARIARCGVVINDLHRSWLANVAFALTAPLLFPNRLILHDGMLSIRRSFIRSEWESYLKQAGFKQHQWELSWRWPFRWILKLRTG